MPDKAASSTFGAAHLAPGLVGETELPQKRSVSTLSRQSLSVSAPGRIQIVGAKVAQAIVVENGMAHLIHRALM